MVKVISTSDLHGHLPLMDPCDILLIGGDICPVYNHDIPFQRLWLDTNFRTWLKECRDRGVKNIVGVWGNHDLIGELPHLLPEGLPWTLLQGDVVEVEGLKIWGGPWQLRFGGAFNLDEPELMQIYAKIPDEIDIVVSHGPPYKVGDKAPRRRELHTDPGFEHAGSRALLCHLIRANPKLVLFGHIHEGYGCWGLPLEFDRPEMKLINGSLVDSRYTPVNLPIRLDL